MGCARALLVALLPLAALVLAAAAAPEAPPPLGLDPAWEESRRRIASALQSSPAALLLEGPKGETHGGSAVLRHRFLTKETFFLPPSQRQRSATPPWTSCAPGACFKPPGRAPCVK
jgi:hypothetical protein